MENKNFDNYDDLVQLKQSGQIGWNEFVLRSHDQQEYRVWLFLRKLKESDDNAERFLKEREERMATMELV